MKLKDRNKGIPGSFRLLIPEIGMVKPVVGTFSSVVGEFSKIVAKNPALAQKHGWPTNRVDQENWIDQRECHRLLAGGYFKFVEMGEASPEKKTSLTARWFQGVGVAAGKVKTAIEIFNSMFGSGGRVVPGEESERRAVVCASCPKNDKTASLTNYFLKEGVAEITGVLGMLRDMEIKTSLDAELGVCKACFCVTKVKVHATGEALKKMPQSEIAELDPSCWIPGAIKAA